MGRTYSKTDVFRGLSVLAVAVLTLVLASLLGAPGYRTSRLVLFGLLALSGWVGAAGAVTARPRLLAGGAAGLFLLGFWQFTVGWVAIPASVVLLVTAILASEPPDGPDPTSA